MRIQCQQVITDYEQCVDKEEDKLKCAPALRLVKNCTDQVYQLPKWISNRIPQNVLQKTLFLFHNGPHS